MDVKIIYAARKTVSLKAECDGSVTVRAPYGVSRAEIDRFVEKHAEWIARQHARLERKARLMSRLEAEDISRLKKAAREYIPRRAEYFAAVMGVAFKGIKITSAKTRFGSCSAENSLCFSLYLMCYPEPAIDAVVVHELAHIRHKDHSRAFYNEVKRVLPDYDERKILLKNGIL